MTELTIDLDAPASVRVRIPRRRPRRQPTRNRRPDFIEEAMMSRMMERL